MKKRRYTEEIHIKAHVPDPPKRLTWGDLTYEERESFNGSIRRVYGSHYKLGINPILAPDLETIIRCRRRDLRRNK